MKYVHILAALLLACCHGSPPPSNGPADESGVTDDAADLDLGAPAADCEVRQLGLDGTIGGPSDIAATCDQDRVVALHRPGAVACGIEAPQLDPCVDPGGECQTDADCMDVVGGGACASFDGLGGACLCVRPCMTDSDCQDDRACICRAGVVFDDVPRTVVATTACWPAECRADEDCGDGGECALVNPEATCVTAPALWCRNAVDACRSDLDCEAGQACERSPEGDGWRCGTSTCQ